MSGNRCPCWSTRPRHQRRRRTGTGLRRSPSNGRPAGRRDHLRRHPGPWSPGQEPAPRGARRRRGDGRAPWLRRQAWSGREGAGMPPGWESEEVPFHDWHRVVGHRGTVATIGMLSNIAELVTVGMPLHASRLVVMGGLFPPTDLGRSGTTTSPPIPRGRCSAHGRDPPGARAHRRHHPDRAVPRHLERLRRRLARSCWRGSSTPSYPAPGMRWPTVGRPPARSWPSPAPSTRRSWTSSACR